MSISLCRRISMALVVCICASFCLLPFRAAAGHAEIDNLAEPVLAQWRRLNSILPTDKEHAAQVLRTLFIQYDVDASFSSVAVEDLEGVAKTFSQIGISAVFKEVALPSGGYGWVLQCDSIESFPVNIYGLYAPGGRIIYSPTEEEDDSAATSSRPSYTAPSTNVDIEYTQVFDSTTNTWVDVEINKYDQSVTNNTTNNNHYWDVDNRQFWDVENNTYTIYNDITYNPSTQTYNVQFSDNRSYTYQFYYEYTYITYIGSSAEYREAYKVYYELPDGRSSGDLTVDDLKGLSLQFDMVNYDKAASDTVTQFLYPFDGNLDNISYYPSSGVWIANASTNYLSSPDGFGGSLVLNSNLPSRLNFSVPNPELSEWSLQFRYYMDGSSSSSPFFVMATGLPSWYTSYLNYSDPNSGNFYNFYGLVSPIVSGMTSVIGSNSWWNYTLNEISAPLLTIFNGNLYAGINDSVLGVDAVDESGFNSGSLASLLPGQWYDITICCYGVDDSKFYSTIYPHPSDGADVYNDWVSSDSYFIYVNGLLVGSYCLPVIQLGIGGATSRNTYYSSNSTSLSFSWNRFWSNTSGSSSQTKLTGSPIWGFSSISSVDFVSTGSGFPVVSLDNLRFLNLALYTGVQSFTPSPVPYDTNLVYVLPSVADLNNNTVAIMSQLPVTGYRVGGIRPTDPTLAAGYVWMHIDGEFVDSVQQWNGAYWEEVTARLYTGVRWIPVTAFNVFTLEDMFDIVDPDGDGGGESVSTIYQYYLWWSGEWGTFQQWLQGTMETLIEAIQNSGSGSGGPVTIVPGYNDQTTTNEITTENPDGSTTVTTIVSNAAGLVYSRSVTTWPPDAEGNVSSIEIYTDSSGVSFRTEIQADKDGHVTIIDPSEATGTLGGFLTMIAQGVMSIATSVIQAFVDLLVEVVEFVLDSVSLIFAGIVNILASLLSALAGFGVQIGTSAEFIGAFYSILPGPIQAGFTLLFVGGVSLGLFRLIHF